jgi:hypothetical protein
MLESVNEAVNIGDGDRERRMTFSALTSPSGPVDNLATMQARQAVPPGLLTRMANIYYEHSTPATIGEKVSVQCTGVESAHWPSGQAMRPN